MEREYVTHEYLNIRISAKQKILQLYAGMIFFRESVILHFFVIFHFILIFCSFLDFCIFQDLFFIRLSFFIELNQSRIVKSDLPSILIFNHFPAFSIFCYIWKLCYLYFPLLGKMKPANQPFFGKNSANTFLFCDWWLDLTSHHKYV